MYAHIALNPFRPNELEPASSGADDEGKRGFEEQIFAVLKPCRPDLQLKDRESQLKLGHQLGTHSGVVKCRENASRH
jgi:hypothetical protein